MTDENQNLSKEQELERRMTSGPQARPNGELPTDQEITNVLMAVEDPELHINVIDLGLIYKIHRDNDAGRVTIDMTLTTPACPYGPQLLAQTHTIISRLPNVKDVKVNTVWSPKWDPRVHASEVAQMLLGLI
jgi:metal-sulfur cluster biosynthetic enzyme